MAELLLSPWLPIRPSPRMRIAFLPAGDEDTASSRIRAYTLAQELNILSHPSTVGRDDRADVLVVQKRVSRSTLLAAVAARKRGALVLYDADDVGSALDFFAKPHRLQRMLGLADAVLTDTAEHAQALATMPGMPPILVIPDAVDYGLITPRLPVFAEPTRLRIVWFGNWAGLDAFAPIGAALAAEPEVELVLATLRPEGRPLPPGLDMATVIPWSRAAMPGLFASCHLSCLVHGSDPAALGKSNNRMVASICWGVPALVSDTPAYRDTARALELNDAVFSDPAGARRALARWRSAAARRWYLERAQTPLWHQYAPAAVARTFLDTLARIQRRNRSISCVDHVMALLA